MSPSPVRELADRVFAYRRDTDWYLRSRLGLPNESMRAESDADRRADASFATSALQQLAGLAPADEDDRLTTGFLEHVLGGWQDLAASPLQGFTVTPYQSMWIGQTLGIVFRAFSGSPDAYLSLVADQRTQVQELRSRLLAQREAGILVPAAALAGTRESLTRLRAASAGQLPALAPEPFRERVTALVDGEVLPAFDALLAVLDDSYEGDAPAELGLSQYEGGEEYYRRLVRQHTASDLTPEQLHQLGLEQVAELTQRMAEVRAAIGACADEQEFHRQLEADPRVHASSADEVEALFLRHMAKLEPLIDRWFTVLPKAPYGVERLPAAAEAGMTYGYYDCPTPEQPVGKYYWNGADLESKSLLTYAAIIFHELAPGHHFHIARQAENLALPDIRRYCSELGAFNEGWAEYAAGLGWEMGLYDNPLDAYGRLVHERFTAQRLVVDTGLNLHGWSFDQAFAYMKANTTDSDGQVTSEVLRYGTDLPAQSLAYRAGYLELTRLRNKSEQALGSRFDVREFHEQLLGPGALPFPVIEAHLDRWAAELV